MKIKESIREKSASIGAFLIVSVVFIIILPFLLGYFLYKLISTPFDYAKYKRSRYQQDFPHKYSWLATPHIDNKVYTIIKENNLPIEYIKWREEYDLNGYFLYKDILLVFEEPFFFDKKRGLWLIWPGNGCDEESEDIDEEDYENTDDCLTVDEAKKYILERFREDVPGLECNRVVLFYSRKNVENHYEQGGLEKMRELDDFIIYDKGELTDAIKKIVESC
ncbi:MAG: hypothetical protein E7679_07030 [Ruminococcaceae bacterium]|nr:hypothetical protein [Oscillospiraceae bacterium]